VPAAIGGSTIRRYRAVAPLIGTAAASEGSAQNQAERWHRRDNEHLDASAGVDGIEAFYERCIANGATILKPLTATAWGTKDFYVEDPDGYIICLGGRPAEQAGKGQPETRAKSM
jgi:catechol 2,3-dioxygenase-like lactoylglutathione lyase family enzyme